MNTLGKAFFGDLIAACAASKLDTYDKTSSYDIGTSSYKASYGAMGNGHSNTDRDATRKENQE